MAILLWELIIAAAFVLVAVGALAYVLANLLLAAIHKAVETKSAGPISAPAYKRSQRQPGDRLGLVSLSLSSANRSVHPPLPSAQRENIHLAKQAGKLW